MWRKAEGRPRSGSAPLANGGAEKLQVNSSEPCNRVKHITGWSLCILPPDGARGGRQAARAQQAGTLTTADVTSQRSRKFARDGDGGVIELSLGS